MTRVRADQLLVARGLVASRARAQVEIAAGHVTSAGVAVEKPSALLNDDAPLVLTDAMPWVSRGAPKLIQALDHFAIDVTGAVAMDIGASTGGFTEVLLARGAARVFAVDVGHGQLHRTLAGDPRVVSLEGRDIRVLTANDVPQVDVVTIDVSFIGLQKVLEPALAFLKSGGTLVALVKPQFEVGPDHVGKGGIVRDVAARQTAIERVAAWVGERCDLLGVIESPITGGDGNEEALLAARRR